MKKLYTVLLAILLISSTSVGAYAINQWIMNVTKQESITIGNTIQASDGLIVTLNSADMHTLTYNTITETDTNKHTLTYIYDYTILLDGYNVQVSSLSDDIVIEVIEINEQISITFSLNQNNDYNEGDIITIQFYFELVESALNINTASYDELIAIGFDDREATEIVGLSFNVYSLEELTSNIYIISPETKLQPLIDSGEVVFK